MTKGEDEGGGEGLLDGLPAELHVHAVLPYLGLSDLVRVSQVSRRFHGYIRHTLTHTHPLVRSLCLPKPLYVLDYDAWHASVLGDEEQRRRWLRELSLGKRQVPTWLHGDVQRVLAACIGRLLSEGGVDAACMTGVLYRTLLILFGLPAGDVSTTTTAATTSKTPDGQTPTTEIVSLQRPTPRLMRLLKHVETCLCSERLLTERHLVPSLTRALFWIQKEKHGRPFVMRAIEHVMLAVPVWMHRYATVLNDHPELETDLTDSIRRFVKGVSDEARGMKLKLQAMNVDYAYMPIHLAVLACLHTATLYPHHFNAQTLATVLRNTLNLMAWGIEKRIVRFFVMRLSWRIMDECRAGNVDKVRMIADQLRQWMGSPGALLIGTDVLCEVADVLEGFLMYQ